MTPEEIKNIRTALQRTQVGMAKIVGTTSITISRWERGDCHPLPIYVEKLKKLRDFIVKKTTEEKDAHIS